MGIPGLLQVLRPIFEKKHVKQFANRRVGVDVYAWLHKGAFACAGKLCTGQPTTLYVDYVLDRVRMLIHYEVIPVLVFDGAGLPMKADTHKERRARREEALKKAKAAQRQGNHRAAEVFFQQAVPVTAEMAREVIKQCRKINVEYVVAPYEADAQLAWMTLNGQIDCVLTEDSDLVVYGASKVMYKMTKHGDGDLFQTKNFSSLEDPPMHNISPDMFMWMCVCAGCDFFEGVKNLGVKRAHGLVKKHRTLSRLLHAIRADMRYPVSRDFMTHFYRACLVFRHQTVFDISSGKAAHLSVFDPARIAMLPSGVIPTGGDGEPDLSFLGGQHSDSLMKGIAMGLIHPSTLKEYLEPLDVVERPIQRQSQSRPKMSAVTAPSTKGTRSGGFQVLPAKRTVTSLFNQTANLKSRLTRGPQSFNPRQIASRLTPGSVVPTTGSIWSSFKRPKKQGDADDLTRPFGLGKRDVRKLTKAGVGVGLKSGRRSAEKLPSTKRPRRHSSDARANRKISPLLPKNSMKRFMNRFAYQGPKSSSALESPERSPSPDGEAYELLAKVEDEGSHDNTHERHSNADDADIIEVKHDECGEERQPQGVIRSRFFSMGKRLTLQPDTRTAAAQERPLVREIAGSVSKRSPPEVFRKRVRGRAVINKALFQDK